MEGLQNEFFFLHIATITENGFANYYQNILKTIIKQLINNNDHEKFTQGF
jgi:hypothetical protein